MIYQIRAYGMTKIRYISTPKSGQEARRDRRKAERKAAKSSHGGNNKGRR